MNVSYMYIRGMTQKLPEAIDSTGVGFTYRIYRKLASAYSSMKLKVELKGRKFATVGEIQEETQAALDIVIKDNDRKSYQEWEKSWNKSTTNGIRKV